MTLPSLLSVNLGRPEVLPGRKAPTGIVKKPTSGARLTRLGVDGDAVLNRKYHGGPEQAVYLYFADDYAWWSEELGAPIPPGTFGENLTISGPAGRQVSIGDRFSIGAALLEVTAHRAPCATLAARMGDPKFVRRFFAAGRPGAYCRVLEEGLVGAGMAVAYSPFAGKRTSVAELMALEGVRDIESPVLRRVLDAPVHGKLRAEYEARLAGIAP